MFPHPGQPGSRSSSRQYSIREHQCFTILQAVGVTNDSETHRFRRCRGPQSLDADCTSIVVLLNHRFITKIVV